MYDLDILCCAGMPAQRAAKIYERQIKQDVDISALSPTACACVIENPDVRTICMWSRKRKPTAAIIVHETFHVTSAIMRNCTMVLTKDTEEAFAYLNEWVFERLRKGLSGGK